MTSETDAEFLDSMEQWVIGSLVFKAEHRKRLFALARRGAEAAARIEQLEAEVKVWQGHAKTAIWSDSEECKFLTARIEQLEAALREIIADSFSVYAIEVARAALEASDDK